MKKLLFTILTAITILQYSVADSVIVGTVKDSVTGSNILSGSIEFIPIDTPKTNSTGDLLFGYKTIAYINDGKFSATLTEGLYDCVIGPFNVTKPITVPAGDNVINLATIYGNTDNSLVTFFQFNALSNSLASMITGSVSGVATATNGYCLPQLSGLPTNSIPVISTSATATNWFFVNIGGIPTLVATNYAAGGWLQKPLWP